MLPIAQVQQHQSVELLALTLRVTDDRGGAYPFQPAGATGEGTRNAWQWRLAYRCTPALDADARALQMEIADITWHRPDAARRRFVPARIVSGPWLFIVALLPHT